VPEPLTDGREVDASLEQIDRGGVAQRVRIQPFAEVGSCGRESLRQLLAQQVATPQRVSGSPRLLRNSGNLHKSSLDDEALATSSCRSFAVLGQMGQSRTLLPLPTSRTW